MKILILILLFLNPLNNVFSFSKCECYEIFDERQQVGEKIFLAFYNEKYKIGLIRNIYIAKDLIFVIESPIEYLKSLDYNELKKDDLIEKNKELLLIIKIYINNKKEFYFAFIDFNGDIIGSYCLSKKINNDFFDSIIPESNFIYKTLKNIIINDINSYLLQKANYEIKNNQQKLFHLKRINKPCNELVPKNLIKELFNEKY